LVTFHRTTPITLPANQWQSRRNSKRTVNKEAFQTDSECGPLDTIGKIFEKILHARILHELSERGLFFDEQFGFRPRHSTSFQLTRLVERITRNFGEKRLTGAVFLDVAKAFDTVWIDGLLYKLTRLNFPSYIVHTISLYLRGRTFEASFQTATSSRRVMRAGVAKGGLISLVLFSLYVN
jgi:hypothetical protein